MDLQLIKTLYWKGKYQELLDQTKNLAKKEKPFSTIEEQAESIFYQNLALVAIGQLDESLILVTQAQDKLSPNSNLQTLILIEAQAHSLIVKQGYEEALAILEEGSNIFDSLTLEELSAEGNKFWLAYYLFLQGRYYYRINALDLSLKYLNQSLDRIHSQEHQKNSEIEIISLNVLVLSYIANIHGDRGELNHALEINTRGLALCETGGSFAVMGSILCHLGLMHREKGEINQALSYHQRALSLRESLGNPSGIASSLLCTGRAYYLKGDLSTALDYTKRGLAITESLGNKNLSGGALFSLILISIELQDISQAQKYLEQINHVHKEQITKISDLRVRLAEALILKQSPRAIQKIRAQEILEQIVNDEIIDFEYTILAMTHLCELLLIELKNYGEPVVMEEVKALVEKYYTLGHMQNSFSIVVNARILQAKLQVIEGDFQKALNLLDQGKTIAEEKELHLLEEKIALEKHLLEEEYDNWKKLIQQNASVQDRLEHARLEHYVKAAQKIIHIQTEESDN